MKMSFQERQFCTFLGGFPLENAFTTRPALFSFFSPTGKCYFCEQKLPFLPVLIIRHQGPA